MISSTDAQALKGLNGAGQQRHAPNVGEELVQPAHPHTGAGGHDDGSDALTVGVCVLCSRLHLMITPSQDLVDPGQAATPRC